MDNEKIKEMAENGFANKRIAATLGLSEQEVKQIIHQNGWHLLRENFSEEKIDYICKLYERGVSAKSLGSKFSIDKRRVQKWSESKGLLRDKGASHRITEFNQHIFDTIDTPEKAYWLGFFYADAYNSDKINTFSLTLKDEDYGHLVKLCNFVGLPENKINRYLSYIGDKTYPTCSIKMYSKHICQKMIELGCPRAKSFIIQYPGWLNNDLNRHFIRGMFDGDGCLSYRENQKEWKWNLVSTNESCEVIQQILLSNLGFIVNFHCISETGNNTYELEQSGNKKILKIMEWLYQDTTIYLDRKHQKYIDLIRHQNNKYIDANLRDTYKVSEEDKLEIVKEILSGNKVGDVSAKYHVHPSSISKFLKEGSYDKIAIINNQPITAKYVKTLDYAERLALVEPLFQYFRQQGWLYPDNISKIHKSWQKLCDFQPNLLTSELFNNSSLATDICKYFCHKFYEATEEGKSTMIEVFNNDDKLRGLIKNRLGFDWWDKEDNDETFNISFRMLIQGMRSSRLVPSISMFKPDIAKYMYMKYSLEGDTVYDYSAGWGGRMLGAIACNRQYIGVDPWTTYELQIMSDTLGLKNVQLINDGSENVKLSENSVDFSFSSPPYFDQEYYSSDPSQAYNNGENYFYDTYWANTLDNVKHMLKPSKWLGLNVKNYPRMLQMAIDRFGEPVESVTLRTVRSHLNKSAGTSKNEYIYMFKNNK